MKSPSRREALALAAGAIGVLGGNQARAQESQGDATPDSMTAGVANTPEGAPDSGVTVQTFEQAERLAAVEYTPDEREQMLNGIDDWIDRLRRVRDVEKPNSLAPALAFDPRLPGKTYAAQESKVRFSANSTDPLPENPEDIAYAPAWKLSQWIHKGVLTSRRLTDIYLDRIEQHGKTLNCFVTVTADEARRQADQADSETKAGKSRGVLHGLPFGLKDLADTAGIRTSWGAEPYKDRVAETDSHVYRKLRDNGAVLIGKTTLGALAYGDRWFGGVTRNPWNPKEGSSGSSAGSASATAAGLCAFAIGTETLGSIISPSQRCGTTGLRPTFGRVGRSGAMALCWSLDKIGALTRSAEDTALVLSVINGPDENDASSLDMGFGYDGRADFSGMKVGYSPAWFEDAETPEREALQAARDLGWNMVEVEIPERPWDGLFAAVEAESAAAFEELTLSNRDDELSWQDDAAWPNTWRRARFITAVDLIQADRLRRLAMQDMAEVFGNVDVIFGPNYASSLLTITNYTGHPQMAVRAGFVERRTRNLFDEEAETGPQFRVPWNVSLWTPLFEERRAIALGRQMEAALNVAGIRPL